MWTRYPLRVWLLRLPGVYTPQADTRLLADALSLAGSRAEARVLDLCTGTGALAIVAARLGATRVTAVDVSRNAVFAARINAAVRRLPIEVRRTDAREFVGRRQFDVVLANPPYVPGPRSSLPRGGPARAWDAGLDGRALLDPLCRAAPELLAPGGTIFVVHSGVCGTATTLEDLRAGGLNASVVARRSVPFGPVMRSRASYLRREGLIESGQDREELVVIRADRPDPVQSGRAASEVGDLSVAG